MSEPSIENLPQWMQDHARAYLETDGEKGHMWDSSGVGGPGPVPTLLLTTTGRRSGKSRLLPLIYGKAGSAHVIVASKGGAPEHPAWYQNLLANPAVGVQVGSRRFHAKARTAKGSERTRLWNQMTEIYPPYIEYQEKTDREIPVVVLDPTDA